MPNKLYEVLIWDHGEDKDGCIGEADKDKSFITYLACKRFYDNLKGYKVKMLMKYASMDDDADGDVLEEDWK